MHNFRNDIRVGFRQMRRNPGVTATAVLALALGIGLTTTVFSMVYGVLLRGLPFDASEEIVHIDRTDLARGVESMAVSIHDFHDWRERQHSFGAIAAFYYGTVNVSGAERPDRFSGAFVTPNTFDLLRVKPLIGRTLRPGDDLPGAEPVIVLGYNVWRDRFAANPDIIGTSLRANGEAVIVIGVMPEHFEFPYVQQMWLPLRLDPLAIPRGKGQQVEVFGRLREGVSLDRANTEMNEIARALATEHPATNEGIGVVVQTFIASIAGEGIIFLYTMLGAVVLVLLVACANVANLLLGRAAARSREVAVRTALGASRGRVIAQFLSETLVLAAFGAGFGIAIAFLGVRLLNDAMHSFDGLPFFIDVQLDGAALLFVLGATLVTTLAAGILPALQAARADAGEVMKDAGRGSSSFRLGRTSRAVVVVEMALSCGLLVAAGLMIRSITNLSNADYIFSTDDVFTARVGLPESTYVDAASQVRFYDELHTRLSALPGVTAASLGSGIPVAVSVAQLRRDAVAVEGRTYARDSDYQLTGALVAAPGYFEALGVAPRRGREFSVSDRAETLPVAIVNESFARRYFADADPIGKRIRMGKANSTEPWRTIVGVVPDLYLNGADDKDPDGIYVPIAQSPQRFMSIVLRTGTDPLGITGAVRDVVADIDADLPIYFVNSLAAQIDKETWFYRLFGAIFMIAGFVALCLASIGLYGVMAFSVKRRTRELGIRIAVGANMRQVLQLIVGQGLRQIGLGLAFGLALAAILSQLLAGLLFEVDPQDPLVFAGVMLTLTMTGIAACVLPALRAARVDPIVALRAE
jgi:putative ABC transport system permease protein